MSTREQRIEYYRNWNVPENYEECLAFANKKISSSDDTLKGDDYYNVLFSVGIFLELCNEKEMKNCFDTIHYLLKIPFSWSRGFNCLIQVLLPHHNRLTDDIVKPILDEIECRIRNELRKGGLLDTARTLYFIDDSLLAPILKGCKLSWFTDHSIIVNKDGKKIKDRIPGPVIQPDDEFGKFIIETVQPKLRPSQTKTMSDVYAATYDRGDLSSGAKSHKGLVNKTIGDRDEQYACLAFSSKIEKIKETNVKGHNTPDFKIIGGNGDICAVAECRTHLSGILKESCKDTIKHATVDKDPGWSVFCSKAKISETTPRIAVSIEDFNPRALYMPICNIKEIVKNLNVDWKGISCLVLILLDFFEYEHRIIVFKRIGYDVPDIFSDRAIIEEIDL